jgi:hypothetical protein
MGTRSSIIVERGDGKFASVYCHWDGYLEHNGRILQEHYNSQARVEELVSHGDMSSLGPRCDKPKGHSFDKRVEGCTVYYGRDRGEKNTEAKLGESLSEVYRPESCGAEYVYVWLRGTGWTVAEIYDDKSLQPLSKALAGLAKQDDA